MFYFSNKKLCWSTRTVRPCKKLITRPRPDERTNNRHRLPGTVAASWRGAYGKMPVDWTGGGCLLSEIGIRRASIDLSSAASPFFLIPTHSTRLEKRNSKHRSYRSRWSVVIHYRRQEILVPQFIISFIY